MADTTTAKRHALDFTNVKDSSGINPRHMPEGDYEAVITGVNETLKDGIPMWYFMFALTDQRSATYPYYCKLQENQLWKVRNLLIAAGKTVPKKRVNVDPNNLVNATVGVTLVDDEYDGKLKSVIDAVFPSAELAPKPTKKAAAAEDDEIEDDEVGEDEDLSELELDNL